MNMYFFQLGNEWCTVSNLIRIEQVKMHRSQRKNVLKNKRKRSREEKKKKLFVLTIFFITVVS